MTPRRLGRVPEPFVVAGRWARSCPIRPPSVGQGPRSQGATDLDRLRRRRRVFRAKARKTPRSLALASAALLTALLLATCGTAEDDVLRALAGDRAVSEPAGPIRCENPCDPGEHCEAGRCVPGELDCRPNCDPQACTFCDQNLDPVGCVSTCNAAACEACDGAGRCEYTCDRVRQRCQDGVCQGRDQGACENVGDMAILWSMDAADATWAGGACWRLVCGTDADCLTRCIRHGDEAVEFDGLGLTEGCARCVAEFVLCAVDKCYSQCADGPTDACTTCSTTHCEQAYCECAGQQLCVTP